MRRPLFLGVLLLCARPSLADEPALSVAPDPMPASFAGLVGALNWAPGSGPAAESNTPAAPSPQTPAPPKSIPTPHAAVLQAPAASTIEVHHYHHFVPNAAAPVMQAVVQAPVITPPATQLVTTTQTVAVPQQTIVRRAGPLRRTLGGAFRELSKIGWDRQVQLVPPVQKIVTTSVVPATAPVMANTEVPAPPMAPVMSSPQR